MFVKLGYDWEVFSNENCSGQLFLLHLGRNFSL